MKDLEGARFAKLCDCLAAAGLFPLSSPSPNRALGEMIARFPVSGPPRSEECQDPFPRLRGLQEAEMVRLARGF